MLPVVTEKIRSALESLFSKDTETWKKGMVHHLKEDNPEINSLLLSLAQGSEDPKSVITAGYLVYNVLELATKEEDG